MGFGAGKAERNPDGSIWDGKFVKPFTNQATCIMHKNYQQELYKIEIILCKVDL